MLEMEFVLTTVETIYDHFDSTRSVRMEQQAGERVVLQKQEVGKREKQAEILKFQSTSVIRRISSTLRHGDISQAATRGRAMTCIQNLVIGKQDTCTLPKFIAFLLGRAMGTIENPGGLCGI